MRPTRLELEGFASFRERTCIDFVDAELFALFGPTGAGKSSLIDAIVFALYGAVPRYDDKRLVAPVISQGLNEARVRLDFTADGDAYTAVRVVQRTRQGATTREARLVRGAETLAANADELTDEVTRLLGLSFEHFTRCVVLPQGAFAQFLHARPAERQTLLVQLLGLDLYRRILELANLRARERENRVELLAGRLEGELAGATPDAVEVAATRVAALEALLCEIENARPQLQALAERNQAGLQAARDAERRATLLAGVRLPPGLETLVRRAGGAKDALARASAAQDQAVQQRAAAESERASLPERAALDAAARTHTELRAAAKRLAAAEAERERTLAEAKRMIAERDAAEQASAEADEALHAVQRERAAATLAQHLVTGDECPVCRQTVTHLPHHVAPPELEAARARCAEAQVRRDDARTQAVRAERNAAAREADATNARAQHDRLVRDAATLHGPDEIERLRGRIDEVDARLLAARRAEDEIRREQRDAQESLAAVEAESASAWTALERTRDELSAEGLAPPPLTREYLQADWDALVRWAAARASDQHAAASAGRRKAEEARLALDARVEEQRQVCRAHDVDADRGDTRDACSDALAAAREHARRLQRDLETAQSLRIELKAVEKEARVARELGRHLNARNFERWLMMRALERLVAGATAVLRELSDGAYSLKLGEGNDFLVVDHRNADESRMARTLSGGETFLASLALALALAGHVAEMAAGGGVRLDALFLDEGFGTLDGATLEVVAAAIEELGSRGRMVGIVTHVRDLAERVPVRFDVRKVSGSSIVERVG